MTDEKKLPYENLTDQIAELIRLVDTAAFKRDDRAMNASLSIYTDLKKAFACAATQSATDRKL